MKICDYCDCKVEDNTITCPYCSSSSFHEICPRCGSAFDGLFCQQCKSDEEKRRAQDEAARVAAIKADEESRAVEKANRGLVWKTILTVFLPFVGGYFLINDRVRKGFRIFAIVWCYIMALATSFSASGSAGGRLIASLACLAPVAFFLFKHKDEYLGNRTAANLAPAIAFCVVLAISLVGSVAGGIRDASSAANTDVKSKAPIASAASAASNVDINSVELLPTTTVLEYSSKQVDPTTLVKPSKEGVEIESGDEIDL